MTIINEFLLSDVGDDVIGQTKTFVTVYSNLAPKGSYTVKVSTTYNKAKLPDARFVRSTIHVDDADKLRKLATFLYDAADSI